MKSTVDDLVTKARKASTDPKECRKTIKALRVMGFDSDAFVRLHHLQDSVDSFYRYCGSVQQFHEDGDNHRVHQRLSYVLLSCPDGALPKGKSFRMLAEDATRLIP